jgi:hypothetical protein
VAHYAQGTDVPVDRSRAEIERTLARYGADQFMYGWKEGGAVIGFRAHSRLIRFTLPLPDKNAKEFTHARVNQHVTGRRVSPEEQQRRFEQACRERWRALSLCIKAKLEAVARAIPARVHGCSWL